MHMIQPIGAPWAPPWPPPTGDPVSIIPPLSWPMLSSRLRRMGPGLPRLHRHWSKAETETLMVLLSAGHDPQVVGDHLGRTRWAITSRCRDMGVRPERLRNGS